MLTVLFPNPDFLTPLLRARKNELLPALQIPSSPFRTRRSARALPAHDAEVGGRATLYGTTKSKGDPNTPTKARIVLLTGRDKRVVRETWSDPATGAWAFTGLDESQTYIVLAEDAAGSFRPVAANRLVPEVLP